MVDGAVAGPEFVLDLDVVPHGLFDLGLGRLGVVQQRSVFLGHFAELESLFVETEVFALAGLLRVSFSLGRIERLFEDQINVVGGLLLLHPLLHQFLGIAVVGEILDQVVVRRVLLKRGPRQDLLLSRNDDQLLGGLLLVGTSTELLVHFLIQNRLFVVRIRERRGGLRVQGFLRTEPRLNWGQFFPTREGNSLRRQHFRLYLFVEVREGVLYWTLVVWAPLGGTFILFLSKHYK